jgi:hypothetical protein
MKEIIKRKIKNKVLIRQIGTYSNLPFLSYLLEVD